MTTSKEAPQGILQLLPKMNNVAAAEIVGCSPRTAARYRKKAGLTRKPKFDWKAWDSLLGVVSDASLAKTMGCTTAFVWQRRKKLGIAAKENARTAIAWEDWDKLLGTMSDVDLAKLVNCTPPAVRYRRIQKGIKPYT